ASSTVRFSRNHANAGSTVLLEELANLLGTSKTVREDEHGIFPVDGSGCRRRVHPIDGVEKSADRTRRPLGNGAQANALRKGDRLAFAVEQGDLALHLDAVGSGAMDPTRDCVLRCAPDPEAPNPDRKECRVFRTGLDHCYEHLEASIEKRRIEQMLRRAARGL